jgi:hypothetical protein
VVEQPDNPPPAIAPKYKRVPPPELKNSIRFVGDPFEPLFTVEEWEASFERTAQQLEGDLRGITSDRNYY